MTLLESNPVKILFVTFILSGGAFSCNTRDSAGPYGDDPQARTSETGYTFESTDVSCGGFPALKVGMAPGTCLGLVVTGAKSFAPRVILEIPGRKNDFLVSDFANWSTTSGKIWRLTNTNGSKSGVKLRVALSGLSLVHQLIAGPNDSIYFSLDHSIKSISLNDIPGDGSPIDPKKVKTILSGLPPMDISGARNSMHPLKHFAFDSNKNLFVNVGAYTDACSPFKGKDCQEVSKGADRTFKNHGAVIRRYKFDKDKGNWNANYDVVAQGLRNSMGLLFTRGGDLIQVENSRDFTESTRPFEEMNLIPKAALDAPSPTAATAPHYGWPYCYDHQSTSDEWKSHSFACNNKNAQYHSPFVLLPPHGAPLGLLHYTGGLLPQFQNKLLVALHGYRPTGHRILAYALDANGIPLREPNASFLEDKPNGTFGEVNYPGGAGQAQAVELVARWNEVPANRPKGAPVALSQAQDGSIWVADDKNHAIYRIASTRNVVPDTPAVSLDMPKILAEIVSDVPSYEQSYQTAVATVFRSQHCQGCHDDFTLNGDSKESPVSALRYVASLGNWVRAQDPDNSVLLSKISPGEGGSTPSMPPMDRPLTDAAIRAKYIDSVKKWIQNTPKSDMILKVNSKTVLHSTAPGQGSPDCAEIPAGSHLVALSKQALTLGGKSVLPVAHHANGRFVKGTECVNKAEKFWVEKSAVGFILP